MKYLETNKSLWNTRTAVHIESEFYDLEGFLNGESSLKEIELALLGDVRGKSVLHLQCHFGQDSISIARMGAKVTGVDFSDKAIEKASELSDLTATESNFICSDVLDLANNLDEKFDIVFSSYGTIGWLPDIQKWGEVVSTFLKPGGKFIFAEFHPIVWVYDNNFEKVSHRYFKSEPIIEVEEGTYADTAADIKKESITWNHGIGEVLTSLISNGLEITSFEEFDYSPYKCFNKAIETSPGKFQLEPFGDKLPLVYALSAVKK